jgi:hypothetical protein
MDHLLCEGSFPRDLSHVVQSMEKSGRFNDRTPQFAEMYCAVCRRVSRRNGRRSDRGEAYHTTPAKVTKRHGRREKCDTWPVVLGLVGWYH